MAVRDLSKLFISSINSDECPETGEYCNKFIKYVGRGLFMLGNKSWGRLYFIGGWINGEAGQFRTWPEWIPPERKFINITKITDFPSTLCELVDN